MIQKRWIEGKTVTRVEYHSIKPRDHMNGSMQVIDRIHFTDGTSMWFVALETDQEPEVEAMYTKREATKEQV